jgi:hypothetical protein
MTEELALEQRVRHAGTIDRDEAPARTRTAGVHELRGDFLADAALAGYEHLGVGPRGLLYVFVQRTGDRAVADELVVCARGRMRHGSVSKKSKRHRNRGHQSLDDVTPGTLDIDEAPLERYCRGEKRRKVAAFRCSAVPDAPRASAEHLLHEGTRPMDIHLVSTLTPEDEQRVAEAMLSVLTEVLDNLPIAYAVRVAAGGVEIAHRTNLIASADSPLAEAGAHRLQ